MQAPHSRTAFELLLEQAERAPNRRAALTLAGGISYLELAERASSIAEHLRADGITRGNRVGLLASNRIEWLEIFFGAAALGATLVPFSTWSTAAELDFLLRDAKVDVLFAMARQGDRDFAADLAGLHAADPHVLPRRVVLLDSAALQGAPFESYARFAEGPPLGELPPGTSASAADPMVILYTSGSSNRPKAVPLDHYAVIENGFNIGERQGLLPSDRVLVSIPLFWSYGIANALPATITHGATLVLQERFEPDGALELIEKHGCTALYTLPAMTNALTAHVAFSPERTRTLRTGVTIGAPQDVLKAAQVLGAREICNIYGSTESYGNCCVTPHDWPLEKRAASQGPPLPGVTLRIVHPETGKACGVGEVGQLEVKGYLTRGYAGDSAKHNGEVFTADGYFKTGDLGHLSAEGYLSYAGRSSEMIKRSGINVSPAEVEEVLQQHADVGLAGVTGLADAEKGEIIVAFVIARAGRTLDVAKLTAHCRDKLSRYKIPDRFEVCEALPLTPTGKLMRRELKALAGRTHVSLPLEGDGPGGRG